MGESGEQDQRQENEPHVHTAAADVHVLCREISFESLSETAHWTKTPTSESHEFLRRDLIPKELSLRLRSLVRVQVSHP